MLETETVGTCLVRKLKWWSWCSWPHQWLRPYKINEMIVNPDKFKAILLKKIAERKILIPQISTTKLSTLKTV